MNQNSRLYEIQKTIFSAITQQNQSVQKSVGNIQNIKGSCLDILVEKEPISIERRIEIYQDAYRIRLLESMKEDFERVLNLVGDKKFEEIVFEYLRRYPSRYANLAEVGKDFPEFLKTHGNQNLFLQASLDWIEVMAQYACEIPNDQRASLNQISLGISYQLVLNPTLHYFCEDNKIVHFAYMKNDHVQSSAIKFNELLFLDFFKSGKSFSEIEEFCQLNRINDDQIQNLITEWVQNEILICQKI